MAAKKETAPKGAAQKQNKAKEETQKQKTPVPSIEARIDRLIDREDSSIKAVASVNIGGAFAVHGIKVIDSYKGMFVSMPSESYTDKDGNKQYRETCHPISGAARKELVQKVQDAYRQALEEQQGEDQAETQDANEAQAHTESKPPAQGM